MRVHFFATFRPIVGNAQLDVPLADGATVQQLAQWLVDHYPDMKEMLLDEHGHLSRRAHIFVDGRSARWLPAGIDTPLRADQKIDVFPAVAGG